MQNMTQLFNHGFVRRTLQTSHFPYRGVFPDLTGAVPAFLVEMVCSACRALWNSCPPCLTT